MNTARRFTTRTARVAAVLLVAVSGIVGCSDKGEDVKAVPQAEAQRQVRQYADAVRSAVGAEQFTQDGENISPCEGRLGELSNTDEIYYAQGIYQMMIPADRHLEALRKARQEWENQGFTIKGERTFGPGARGEVEASTSDEYSLHFSSGNPPAMVLMVASPCYRDGAAVD